MKGKAGKKEWVILNENQKMQKKKSGLMMK
jgi:hypothetical protein